MNVNTIRQCFQVAHTCTLLRAALGVPCSTVLYMNHVIHYAALIDASVAAGYRPLPGPGGCCPEGMVCCSHRCIDEDVLAFVTCPPGRGCCAERCCSAYECCEGYECCGTYGCLPAPLPPDMACTALVCCPVPLGKVPSTLGPEFGIDND